MIFDRIEASLHENILNGKIKSISQVEFSSYRLELLGILKDNAPFISAMLSTNGDLTFESQLIIHMRNFSRIGLAALGVNIDETTDSRELTLQFMANGIIGLIRYWLSHEDMAIETIATTMDGIMSNGIISTLSGTD